MPLFSPKAHFVLRKYASQFELVRKLRTAIRVFNDEGFEGVRLATGNYLKALTGNDRTYAGWIRKYDTLNEPELELLRNRVQAMSYRPLVSILMPVYDVREDLLVEAIDSVRAQIYPHWQLCIADDASTLAHIKPVLERFQRSDDRIKVIFRKTNGHISRASNSALELATGDWVALLDHDDLLRPHSLLEVVSALQDRPDVKLLYSDEDKLNTLNFRCQPYFKPDWNYELFLSHNLVTHLAVFRTSLVRELGGFRPGYEGAQDYDLTIRVVERCGDDEIVHVPKILYHWRQLPGSTALSSDEKPYAMAAGERALNDHYQRTCRTGRAHLFESGYRTVYELPQPEPKVSIIVPTRDRLELLRKCVASILENTNYANWELIIVDNASREEATKSWLAQIVSDPRIRVISDDGDFNYSRLNNRAVNAASGEFILLLNNDIESINPDWLCEMVSVCAQPRIGAVGARLWYPDGTMQHGGVIMGLGGLAAHAHTGVKMGNSGYMGRAVLRHELSAVTGACLLTRRDLYQAVGGLDEEYLKVAYNDVDYCLKLRSRGWRIVWTPFADLYHDESASRGSDETPENLSRFRREQGIMRSRWQNWIDNDPAYNPNLTLNNSWFHLAFPPRYPELGEAAQRKVNPPQ